MFEEIFHRIFEGRKEVTSDCLNDQDPRPAGRGLIDQKPIVGIL